MIVSAFRVHAWWLGVACLAVLACGGGQEPEDPQTPPAEEQAPPAAQQPAAAEVVDEEALAVLRHMTELLRGQQSFSFTADMSHEALQETGERLEFGATRRYLVKRPNRVRVETTPRDAGPRLFQFDGKLLTLLDVEQKAYAQVEREGDLDATIDFLQDALATPLPLAELLRSEPGKALEEGWTTAYRVGVEQLGGVTTDHLFLRNADVDAQLWIAQGDAPTPQLVTITYRNDDGAPRFRAELTDWKLAAPAPDSAFAFQAPAGAERIQFAVPPKPAATEAQ
ncbi:MAG TPA: DUF2092 domain-containing protein [Myxococcota bacterium]|nr:DUF2092 domain-containing protein [Myxococcota bacterium]